MNRSTMIPVVALLGPSTMAEEWEDLEQEVFLRVFEALPRWKEK